MPTYNPDCEEGKHDEYKAGFRKSGLKVGDRVRVTRVYKSFDGWDNLWPYGIEVGDEGVINDDAPDSFHGVSVNFDKLNGEWEPVPYFALEKIDDISPWIRVENQLPPLYTPVFACGKNLFPTILERADSDEGWLWACALMGGIHYNSKDGKWKCWDSEMDDYEVEFWHPFPQPPEGWREQ
jgi:hypothetical protein